MLGRFLNKGLLRPLQNEYELNMMWNPLHIEVTGKERDDHLVVTLSRNPHS
jgi:hypothetical protein